MNTIFLMVSSLFVSFVHFSQNTSALTTVPTKMNFQGRLTSSSGAVMPNGTYNMKLSLYDSASGGSPVWMSERFVSLGRGVVVTNGTFAIQLGSVTALTTDLFDSGALYLEVELPSPGTATSMSPVWTEGPMTPRNQVATSAYAFNAESLDGIDSTSFAQLGITNTWTGSNSFDGATFSIAGTASSTKFNVSNLFNVDSSAGVVSVGSTDSSATVFILDTKNTAGDPTGPSIVSGAMYYNSIAEKFRCFEAGSWRDCIGGPLGLRSFIDSTENTIVDADTTNYWDTSPENNNSTPNIAPSTTTTLIWGVVTMESSSTGNQDLELTTRIERGIGSVPTCGSGTTVGGRPGTFSSNAGTSKSSTVTFVDSPSTTSSVYYVLCSDAATVGTTGAVTRIRVTLQEANNSN